MGALHRQTTLGAAATVLRYCALEAASLRLSGSAVQLAAAARFGAMVRRFRRRSPSGRSYNRTFYCCRNPRGTIVKPSSVQTVFGIRAVFKKAGSNGT